MSDEKKFIVSLPTWSDPEQKIKVSDILNRLEAISRASVEPNTRLASVTKEAAHLNAVVAETSSNATLKAAQVVADALDRSIVASNRSGDRMWWLTFSYVFFTAALVLIAGLQLARLLNWM